MVDKYVQIVYDFNKETDTIVYTYLFPAKILVIKIALLLCRSGGAIFYFSCSESSLLVIQWEV